MSQKVDILTLETEQALKYDVDCEQPYKNLLVYISPTFFSGEPKHSNRSCYANLGLVQTSNFSCAEPNANEQNRAHLH